MRRLVLLIALLSGVIAPALAEDAAPAGTYYGQVTSGGVLSPSSVTFLSDRHGGCYHVVDAASGPYDGQLSDGQSLGDDVYRFTWSDKFGVGTVTFAFRDGGAEFSGKWYFADHFAGVWLAKKSEDGDLECKPVPVASLN